VVDLRQVVVPTLQPSRLFPVIGEQRSAALKEKAEDLGVSLGGTKIWNVSSTATGGGVAEMLQVLVGYALGIGLDVSWLILEADARFFGITKRLHNRIHGVAGDVGELGTGELQHYRQVTEANARALLPQTRRGDVVILHDPQTAGLIRPLAEAGLHVIWRCHIGADRQNVWTEQAWQFVAPDLETAAAVVFTRAAYVPPQLADASVAIIPPSIDPFSPKNQELSLRTRHQILQRIGVLGSPPDGPAPIFNRGDGTTGRITSTASVVSDGTPLDPSRPLVVQVSRWDRLKDMPGVMQGFAEAFAEHPRAELALVGPAVEGVTDDPEGAEVLEECISTRARLPRAVRGRIRLISLPMSDVDANAVMVNAIQSQATVIVQKSLAEGFGLTVAEGMWKAKAVVASAVGGIVDQIAPGTGVLLDDPTDLGAFGDALRYLFSHPDHIVGLGQAARRYVNQNFIGDLHLLRYGALIEGLVGR
jgi:trehalose synthase